MMATGKMQLDEYEGDGEKDRDVREDSIEARMEELDRSIGQLAETVSVIPNQLERILRAEAPEIDDRRMKEAEDQPMPGRVESQLSERIKRQRQQLDRIRRQINAAMDRVDLT
jgi:vacuolar-type H+-ATPase subunit I/STV1